MLRLYEFPFFDLIFTIAVNDWLLLAVWGYNSLSFIIPIWKNMQPKNNKIAAINQVEMYDIVGNYSAELYDRVETQTDDVELIKSLIGDRKLKILEPFCGHGRILIPLAQAGCRLTGLDLSDALLRRLEMRTGQLPEDVMKRISYRKMDVIAEAWPQGFDVVLLGSNCFYELATPDEQEHCVRMAAQSLVDGGYMYMDNNHMEGCLDQAWIRPGVQEKVFPSGVCADGTRVETTSEVVWYDEERRLIRFRKISTIETLDGNRYTREWIQQKHPPSSGEMLGWLEKYGFEIEEMWGDRFRAPYVEDASRLVVWARKNWGHR